jgi:outer membrane protein TolC
MKLSHVVLLVALATSFAASAQEPGKPAARHISLDEAVQLALKHNHVVRIAEYKVEEKRQAKEIARSVYFPLLRTDESVLRVTDSQFIGIPQGALGIVNGTPIPERSVTLNQGGHTFVVGGVSLTQPLTGLFKVKSANDLAAAELSATRGKQRQTENTIVLAVHRIYYRLLIAQTHREAVKAKILASDSLNSERMAQVKFGGSLEEQAIESHAAALEANQDLLITELQLSDLTMQLNDAIGLPLSTPLDLDGNIRQDSSICEREACVRLALESHPEVAEAQAEVEKASAAVRLAKREYLPDVEAFARYSYQDHVPFLARNFGTFGIHLGYELFDGGRRNAAINEHKAQLNQAEENLARMKEEVEFRVLAAYNKLERTRQMIKVSDDLFALRTESHRLLVQQAKAGAALASQEQAAAARELEAKTLLLQSQLDYVLAQSEVLEASGQTPQ